MYFIDGETHLLTVLKCISKAGIYVASTFSKCVTTSNLLQIQKRRCK